MMIIDASVVCAGLLGMGRRGEWSEARLAEGDLRAPHVLSPEVVGGLRRQVRLGVVAPGLATLAFADFLRLRLELLPFEPVAKRVWELRDNLSPYDAWYVAIAEALDEPLVTLDLRLARSPGPSCEFVTPDFA